MRKEMVCIKDCRVTVTATVSKFGIKRGYKGDLKTILLTDIRDNNNNLLADHLWFNLTKGFADLELQVGERIELCGRCKSYTKGYKGHCDDPYVYIDHPITNDYKLSHPTKIKRTIPKC